MKYYTPQACIQLDHLTQNQFGISAQTLMETAGKSCARAILKQVELKKFQNITVLSGPGNNGGDGLVVARELVSAGYPVRSVRVRSGQISEFLSQLGEHPGLVVDALFGIGARFPFSEFWHQVFQAVMDRAAGVVAIDHPSGFPTTDGLECSDPHISATYTLSIGLPKFAQYTSAGPAACGQIIMCDAGFPQAAMDQIQPFATSIDVSQVKQWMPSPPAPHAHKNQLGHVGFLAGSSSMPGALSLCVQGALQAEAGKITVFGFDSDFAVFQRLLPPEVMYGSLGKDASEKTKHLGEWVQSKRVGSLVVGPGLQLPTSVFLECLQDVVGVNIPLILDAEAFRLIPRKTYERLLPKNSQVAWIGHLGEQQKFFDRPSAQEMFVSSLDCYAQWMNIFPGHVWLRKGLGSVVVSHAGRWLNTSGNYGLAKGGSGDLLAGIIGALSLRLPLDQAVSAGVWIHGRTADIVAQKSGGPSGVTPSACVSQISHVFSEIYA